MSIGYTSENHVWAIDRYGHRAGPVHKVLIALDPDRYEIDKKHPVVDAGGRLLTSKPVEPKGPDEAPTEEPSETTQEN